MAIHAITDGRDTPTQSALGSLTQVQNALEQAGLGRLASLCGRYWAMDRDKRWDRTEKAYDLYTDPTRPVSDQSPQQLLAESYAAGITDEFLEPVRLSNDVMKEGDSVLVFNFRPDRARQIVQTLCLADFDGFGAGTLPAGCGHLHPGGADLPVSVAFHRAPRRPAGSGGGRAGLRQYRTAETEKYPTSPIS